MTGAARWFVAAGSSCVVVGGLVAAATGPTGFEDGSWVAAYLVLVGGVAQIALGVGQQLVGAAPIRPGLSMAELVAWNTGVIATIGGTVASSPRLVASPRQSRSSHSSACGPNTAGPSTGSMSATGAPPRSC